MFQGDVEAVASKSPQELTKLLEQISGSDQFIAEYEDLLKRKNEAEENTIYSMQKKKMYSTQCREVKGQKDEADYYQDKQDELNDLRTEYVLWKIYCAKLEMEGKQDEAEALREQLVVIKSNDHEIDEELNVAKKEYARVGKIIIFNICFKQYLSYMNYLLISSRFDHNMLIIKSRIYSIIYL